MSQRSTKTTFSAPRAEFEFEKKFHDFKFFLMRLSLQLKEWQDTVR